MFISSRLHKYMSNVWCAADAGCRIAHSRDCHRAWNMEMGCNFVDDALPFVGLRRVNWGKQLECGRSFGQQFPQSSNFGPTFLYCCWHRAGADLNASRLVRTMSSYVLQIKPQLQMLYHKLNIAICNEQGDRREFEECCRWMNINRTLSKWNSSLVDSIV